ncbi:MAG: phenylalanine--tRNA ligase subunit beta [Bacteroidales bacterium]|nr:phenylalanine--tRNA ligase subunit beta [Bacteroidales bacterium]
MKISYNWLKDYLKCDLTPEEVATALTSIGLEVDSLEEVEAIPGGLAGVIVAEVVECVEHPDSDHLHITKLNTGEGELLQVVCGAPNVAAGQKVLLATVGTVLGEDFKIKKSKIRGVESFGMICAEDELGIGEDHSGIMVLDPAAVPGTSAKEYLKLETEAIIEIGLTANRVDAASHIGVARDLYAYLRLNNIPCELCIPDVTAFEEGEGEAMPVVVEAPAAAPRYTGTTIKGVKVAPSPEWLQKKLLSIGLRPINNIVDITNFVLMEVGQPLHAFDASKVIGGKVIVRMAAEGEKFVTLDGVERTLSANDLMIANSEKSMCLAGVFGGEESGVTDSTVDVFLESAYFNPVNIRKSSKRHGLKTDASFRYERGCDPLVTEWAGRRAALLIQELAGGQIVGKVQKVFSEDIRRKEIDLDYARIENFVGKKLGWKVIEDILVYLNYNFVERNYDEAGNPVSAKVEAPSYMIDVYRECDVVEEILRIYGYNNIELPSNMKISVNPTAHPEPEAVRNAISDFLAANGFVETMNNSLTKGDYYSKFQTWPEEKCVRIVNPLSSDLNVMRQTLLLGGLEVVAYNINRQINTLRTFEYGSVYSRNPEMDGKTMASYEEHQNFALVMTGSSEKVWRADAQKGSFYQLKGYLELLLRRFGADVYSLEAGAAPADFFAEGITYSLPGRGAQLAVLGTVAPAVLKRFGIKQPVFACEISWPVLFELIKRDKIKYKELPKFPEVKRDLALLLDENVSYADLRKSALKAGKKMVKSVNLFDVYRGDKIPAGKKQYALSFVLQDPEKTLTDMDVERIMGKLLATFTNEWGATLR